MKIEKFISTLLICCLLIQAPLINTGCMSFYPSRGDNNLAEYKNNKGKILLKLENGTKFEIDPGTLFFVKKSSEFIYGAGQEYDYKNRRSLDFKGVIENDKIDSSKVIENNSIVYHLFWMNDRKKLTVRDDDLITVKDSTGNFWIVLNPHKKEFLKINNSNIKEIQIQKVNWVTTTILIAVAVTIVGLLAATSTSLGGTPNFSGMRF